MILRERKSNNMVQIYMVVGYTNTMKTAYCIATLAFVLKIRTVFARRRQSRALSGARRARQNALQTIIPMRYGLVCHTCRDSYVRVPVSA